MNGEPAFPIAPDPGFGMTPTGMTLRDYFAAAVINGILACGQPVCAYYVERAYKFADLMLEERAK
jgi:hypothetical protein